MKKKLSGFVPRRSTSRVLQSPTKQDSNHYLRLNPLPKKSQVETRQNSILRKLAQLTPMHSYQIEEVPGIQTRKMSKKQSSLKFDKEEDNGVRNIYNFLHDGKDAPSNFIPGAGQTRGEMTTDAFMKLLGNEEATNQNPFSKLPKLMLPEMSVAQSSNASIKPKILHQPLSSISPSNIIKHNMPPKMGSLRVTRSFTNMSHCSQDKR